jgi:replicative DNA helicase
MTINKVEMEKEAKRLKGIIEESTGLEEKQAVIKKSKIEQQYERITQAKEDSDRIKKFKISEVDEEYLAKMNQDHEDIRKSLENKLPFINPILSNFLDFSYPNLIGIGAKTGHGKSTCLANIAHPLLGEKKKVLVISNEEMSINIFNRIGCIHKGWNINGFDNFTEEQHAELTKFRENLYRTNRLRVIDNDFPALKGASTSYSGLSIILDKLLEEQNDHPEKKAPYDAILIDYYQKFSSMGTGAGSKEWEVLSKVSEKLDNFYKFYKGPVVIFSQLKPDSDEGGQDIEFRVKGSKSLYIVSTFFIELIPEKKSRLTKLVAHKVRFKGQQGQVIDLGWDKGRFVEYTNEFKVRVAQENLQKEERSMMAGVFKKEDHGKS